MKVFNAHQIREIDQYTIKNEPISSIDLMERASLAFIKKFKKIYSEGSVKIFCGTGNNGGDGLAVARLLNKKKYEYKK